MVVKQYSDCFWDEDLKSKRGYEALKERNHEGKKVCQEVEDYLKKRAKLESEYSKSLKGLKDCFKKRDPIGDLDIALVTYMTELDTMATSHHATSEFFSRQADDVKSFREIQVSRMKSAEEYLSKSQSSKINQLKKTMELEKLYRKKGLDRDAAEKYQREVEYGNTQDKDKEIKKARSRCSKTEEDFQKANEVYIAAVEVLDQLTTEWERTMEATCKAVQALDKDRIQYLRNAFWVYSNQDSRLALEIDNSCEIVRQKLEKCDISQDVQAFLDKASIGSIRPRHYVFRNYTTIKDCDSDGDESISSIETLQEEKGRKGDSGNRKMKLFKR